LKRIGETEIDLHGWEGNSVGGRGSILVSDSLAATGMEDGSEWELKPSG